MPRDYDVEMRDVTTGESLGTRPIGEEFDNAEAAQAEANELAQLLSDESGDDIEAGKVQAE